jgi:hypothetical protein
MQASKINVGDTYAVRLNPRREGEDGPLMRFIPTSITTTVTGDRKSPHNHKSTVRGYTIENGVRAAELTYAPDLILGPYEDYKALVEVEAKEKVERQLRGEEDRRMAAELRTMLYLLVGELVPDVDPAHYRQLFRVSISGTSVDLGENAVELLHKALYGPQGGVTAIGSP